MRYRYRTRRQYRPRGKFFFSDRDIDFTGDSFSYEQFLLQEFFSTDVDTLSRIRDAYTVRHGKQAFDYLSRKYHEWREGDFHLTELMRDRILALMPDFLSPKAIHDLGLYEFSQAIKGIIQKHERNRLKLYNGQDGSASGDRAHFTKNRTWRPSAPMMLTVEDWRDHIANEMRAIESLTTWPHRYRELEAEEADEALEIARYILHLKLAQCEQHVLRDLSTMLPYGERLHNIGAKVRYEAPEFGVAFDIAKGAHSVAMPISSVPELVESNGEYQVYADRYMAYEATNVQVVAGHAECGAAVSDMDLHLLLERIAQLHTTNRVAKLDSSFRGSGGILIVSLEVIPPNFARAQFVRSGFKVLLACGAFIVGVAVLVRFALWPILVIVLPALFLFVGYLQGEFGEIRNAARNLRKHG